VPPERAIDDVDVFHITKKPTESDSGADQTPFTPITPARVYVQKRIDNDTAAIALGRRKTAQAKVTVRSAGSGRVQINGRDLVDFTSSMRLRDDVLQPLVVTESLARFDVTAAAVGGGVSGQIGAVRLGLARALVNWDPEWRPVLKQAGLLTRDPRMVERKKTGQPKARKKWQWSKR